MPPREGYLRDLEQLRVQIRALATQVSETVEKAIDAFEHNKRFLAEKLIVGDEAIDQAQENVEEHILVTTALQQPVASDLRLLLAALEIAAELERIGDYAKRIAKVAYKTSVAPTTVPSYPFKKMGDLALGMLHDVIDAFDKNDAAAARAAARADDQVDAIEDEVRADLLQLIQREPAAAEWAIDRMLVAHTIERMADRVTNIAEQVVFILSGERTQLNS